MSLLIGTVLISMAVGVIGGITDAPRNSALFTVSASVVGFSVCLLLIKGKKVSFRITAADIFMMVSFVLYLCTRQPFASLWDIGCSSLFFIYWSIRVIGNKWNYTLLYGFVLVAILILSSTGYLQYVGLLPSNSPYFVLTGPYRNPTIYAGMLCLLLVFPAIWILSPGYRLRYPKLGYVSIIALVIGFPLLIATACRSAWLAFVVAIGLYVLTLYCHSVKRVWKQPYYWIMGLLVLVSAVCGLYHFKPDSADGRFFIWKVTSQMIEKKPLTGFGVGGFATHYMLYQAAYLKAGGSTHEHFLAGSNHAVYNEPLRLAVGYGVIGLLIYIGFVYVVFKSSLRKNIVTASARSVLAAALVWGFFAYPDQAFPIQFVMLLAFTFLSGQGTKEVMLFRLPPSAFNWLQVSSLAIALVFCYKTAGQYYAHHTFYRLLCHSTEDTLDTFIADCSLLEALLWYEPSFWIYYCTALDKKGYDCTLREKILRWEQLYPTPDTYIMKGDLLQRMGRPKEAETAYWLAHYMVPSSQKARSRLALLYRGQGRAEEAVALVREILSGKVKVYGFETYRIHDELKRIFEDQLK